MLGQYCIKYFCSEFDIQILTKFFEIKFEHFEETAVEITWNAND